MPQKILVILGSVRESAPPRPARLGLRVARACLANLESRGMPAALVDPLDLDLGGAFKPYFANAPGKAPADLEALAGRLHEGPCGTRRPRRITRPLHRHRGIGVRRLQRGALTGTGTCRKGPVLATCGGY